MSAEEEDNEDFNPGAGGGVALACPTTVYANENRNIIEELFFGSDFSHRAHEETAGPQSSDPFIPRRTDGLSSNIDAGASKLRWRW
jgi:hypothetical protein